MQNQIHEEIIDAELVMSSQPSTKTSKSFIERLLSPTTLAWMMTTGGGLLIVGFAVWLWSIGVFENPLILATSTGVTNLALLIGGIFLYNATRYRLAGRGLTLLASLSLPLNLWLYESQGLITLESGNLWIPALMCSIAYAVVARVTRDHLSVYTLVGGVMMTGVLFILGSSLETTWAVFAIATFFIGLGASCIHLDHWFNSETSEFSRDNFGLACFRSGHISLMLGLGLLFAGPFVVFGQFVSAAKLWTMCLLGISAYCYYYTNTTDRRHGLFTAMQIGVAAWFVTVLFVWINIKLTLSLVCIVLSVTMISANVARSWTGFKNDNQKLVHLGFTVSLAMFSLMFAGAELILSNSFMFANWANVLQMTLISCLVFSLPDLWKTNTGPSAYLAIGLAAAVLNIAAFSTVMGTGVSNIGMVVAAASALSMCIATANYWVAIDPRKKGVASMSVAAATLLVWAFALVSSLVDFTSLLSMFAIANLLAAFVVTNFITGSRSSLAGSGVCLKLFLFQVAVYFNLFNGFAIVSGITITGIVMLAFSRIESRFKKQLEGETNIKTQVWANSVICVGAVAACLFTLSELFASSLSVAHAGLLLSQLASIGIAAMCTTSKSWRSAFIVVATAVVGMTIIVHFNISTLNVFQKMEVGSLALGMLMVVAGHIGWAKENSNQHDSVSFNLIVGSILLAAPLAIGLVFDRFAVEATMGVWRYIHEIGGIAVGLSLLAAGILCRIRSTTLTGVALLSTAVISNILLIDLPEQLQTTSAIMMIGGGVFFALSLTLSVYRDRIISLPEKIKNGKGVFQVLKWR